MAEPTESRIAKLLGDRYEVIDLIGKGGFAGVYRVRNLRLQRTEAVKVLSEMLMDDADFAKRFEQEARVAAALDHPNIVKIYDYGAVDAVFWFSMQYIDGASVGKEVKKRGRLEDSMAARIVGPVLDALSYSHGRGVIHRDIKPDNVLLDRTERPYLTDFGVAKSETGLVKTVAGTLLGSPAYMSPEQLQGKALDGRSDIYSVGVTLYKMLSGSLPFTGEDTFRATMKRLSESPAPLSTLRPDIHPILEGAVMRALERDPADRFRDAASMRDELEDFLAEVTPPRVRISSPVFRPDDSSPTRSTPSRGTSPTSPSGVSGRTPRKAAARAIPARDVPTIVTPVVAPGPGGAPFAAHAEAPVARRPSHHLGWLALAVSLALLAAAILFARRPHPAGEDRARPTSVPKETPTRLVPPTLMPVAAQPSPVATPEPAPTGEPQATAPPVTRAPRRAQLAPTRVPTRIIAPTSAPTAVAALPTSPPVEPGKRTPPEIVEQAPLVLSKDLIAMHHNESIGMVVVIGIDGSLKSARVISPVCPECDRAALESLRRYRFRPAVDAKGDPVEGTFGFAIRIP